MTVIDIILVFFQMEYKRNIYTHTTPFSLGLFYESKGGFELDEL